MSVHSDDSHFADYSRYIHLVFLPERCTILLYVYNVILQLISKVAQEIWKFAFALYKQACLKLDKCINQVFNPSHTHLSLTLRGSIESLISLNMHVLDCEGKTEIWGKLGIEIPPCSPTESQTQDLQGYSLTDHVACFASSENLSWIFMVQLDQRAFLCLDSSLSGLRYGIITTILNIMKSHLLLHSMKKSENAKIISAQSSRLTFVRRFYSSFANSLIARYNQPKIMLSSQWLSLRQGKSQFSRWAS